MQSMSLREIIRRFIRKEALPIERQGIYEDRFEDLEKLGKQDITVQMERAEDLREKIDTAEKKVKARAEKAKETPPPPLPSPVPPVPPVAPSPPLP